MSHYVGETDPLPGWTYRRPSALIAGTFRVAPPGCKHPSAGCCAKNKGGEIVGRQFPEGTVKITPQEAAALQSYPADFEFVGTKGSVGLQIGNAVPPLLARAILEELWS